MSESDPMVEFVEQVADALWFALGTSPIPQQSPPSYVGAVRALAPRVAAAIEAAYSDYGNGQRAALAVLLGAP